LLKVRKSRIHRSTISGWISSSSIVSGISLSYQFQIDCRIEVVLDSMMGTNRNEGNFSISFPSHKYFLSRPIITYYDSGFDQTQENKKEEKINEVSNMGLKYYSIYGRVYWLLKKRAGHHVSSNLIVDLFKLVQKSYGEIDKDFSSECLLQGDSLINSLSFPALGHCLYIIEIIASLPLTTENELEIIIRELSTLIFLLLSDIEQTKKLLNKGEKNTSEDEIDEDLIMNKISENNEMKKSDIPSLSQIGICMCQLSVIRALVLFISTFRVFYPSVVTIIMNKSRVPDEDGLSSLCSTSVQKKKVKPKLIGQNNRKRIYGFKMHLPPVPIPMQRWISLGESTAKNSTVNYNNEHNYFSIVSMENLSLIYKEVKEMLGSLEEISIFSSVPIPEFVENKKKMKKKVSLKKTKKNHRKKKKHNKRFNDDDDDDDDDDDYDDSDFNL
jgi:hypothetical protein